MNKQKGNVKILYDSNVQNYMKEWSTLKVERTYDYGNMIDKLRNRKRTNSRVLPGKNIRWAGQYGQMTKK